MSSVIAPAAGPEAMLFTYAEAARAMSVCQNVVEEMVRSGELPHVKIGVHRGRRRCVRIPRRAIEAWIQRELSGPA